MDSHAGWAMIPIQGKNGLQPWFTVSELLQEFVGRLPAIDRFRVIIHRFFE